ncbi:MAG: LptF/LptG family permease [Phycisphaerales bacterium]|nr:LptF/LptG family permease [Phycisphaerales bacterium]
MPQRSPVLLWLHVTAELWRLLLLTVAVLVTVIAFAAAIKPLADGKLGPVEAIKFMVLAMPPMLAYALPFSAGFAATLAYHRMAQDNELLAAHAGGIAHRTLLVPALFSGAVLFLTLASLNEYIIPRFLQSMDRLVAQDLTKLLVNSIERGHAVQHGNLMVYADEVIRPDATIRSELRDQGVTDALELRRVVFADTDSDGNLRNSVVASKAEVYVRPKLDAEGRSDRAASILVFDGIGWKEDGTVVAMADFPRIVLPIPNAFHDDPKFLTWGELRSLRRHPDRMDFVHNRTLDLAYFLGRRATAAAIASDLQSNGQVKLQKAEGGDIVVLRGAGWTWSDVQGRYNLIRLEDNRPFEVERWKAGLDGAPGGGGITHITARDAWFIIGITQNQLDRRVSIELHLLGARVDSPGESAAGDVSGLREDLEFTGLQMAYDPLPEFTTQSAYELLAIAEPKIDRKHPDSVFEAPTRSLRAEVDNLQREITSKQNERWALASSCLIMVITGAITAVRLRESMPLAVYLWSFFPALGAVITIMGGQQLTHESGAPGLFLLWGGVAGLAAYTFLSFLAIRKH